MKYSLFFLIALVLVLATDGHTSWFCNGIENGHLPEGCTFEEALEHHSVSEAENEQAKKFVGRISTLAGWGGGTGFLFQTEKCKGNNLVLTNAHVLFDRETGELAPGRIEFCLSDGCYLLDASKSALEKMEEAGLIGAKFDIADGGYRKDFAILPLAGAIKIKSGTVPALLSFGERHMNKEVKLSGMNYNYDSESEIRTVQNCEITDYDAYSYSSGDRAAFIKHSCPGKPGFSGSPIMLNGKVVAIDAASSGDGGKPYSPNNYNIGSVITEDLIESLNSYCSLPGNRELYRVGRRVKKFINTENYYYR